MEARIVSIEAKKMLGIRQKMTLKEDKTPILWGSFMPKLRDIQHVIGVEKYALRIYPLDYFSEFNPSNEFEQWAAVEISNVDKKLHGLEFFTLEAGDYAVFNYKGKGSEGASFFEMIFVTWLPNSDYYLDNRPHVACMVDLQP